MPFFFPFLELRFCVKLQQEQWPDSRDGQFQGRSLGPADLHTGLKRQQVSLDLQLLICIYFNYCDAILY